MIPPRLAIAYVRVSTEDQKLGPDAQRAAIASYAAREGLTIASWHVDAGISGAAAIEDRPALLEALAAVRTVKATALIVAKRDRLARDVLIATTIERSLPKGATVISADGTGNGSAPADALMRTILDGMSEYERALIRGRTKAALAAKKAKGERTGTVPYGYRLSENGRTVEPDAREQATIQLVHALRAQGASQPAIVRALAAAGHLSRNGKALHLNQVQKMLLTPPRTTQAA